MWRCIVAVCLVLCAIPLAVGLGEYSRVVSYSDQVVVRCMDKFKATVQLLQQNTDEWHVGDQSIDLRMSRRMFAGAQKYVPECHVLIDNVEAHVRAAEAQMFPAKIQEEELWAHAVLEDVLKTKPSLAECEAAIQNWETARFNKADAWFEEYHNYDAIVMWYKYQASNHSNLVRYVESIGKSYHGLDMPAVHITASTNPQRRKIYFQCQIHAREWISGAVCMYVVNHLLTKYGGTDEVAQEVTDILNNVEFIIVPFVNPDGYEFTWSTDRLWRKNRRIVSSQAGLEEPCVGVDINRNFPEGWKAGGKMNPIECAEDYGGPNPSSEPETQNIMNYWKQNGPIIGAIDWHSYGQLILHPWAWTQDNTKHDGTLVHLGQEMADIIEKVHGSKYTSEKSIDLYQCFGIATDWFYSDDAASNNGGYRSAAFVIELRDKGEYGFLLPAEQIIPTGEELFPAVLHFAKSLMAHPIPYMPKDAVTQNYAYNTMFLNRYGSRYGS